mmetsp:Transcript_110684/g.220011  ORF Transcript_110684/g.220011 Transcript_110684/m.220011 type:complete len:324 (+) Transcript_110684:39-1010(+)
MAVDGDAFSKAAPEVAESSEAASPVADKAATQAEEPVPGAAFTPGTVVRLVGLQKSEFNHHIGRVVSSASQAKAGRVGVTLHSIAWPASGISRFDGNYAPMAIKPENLRRVRLPSPTRRCRAIWGSVAPDIVLRLFGDSGFGFPAHVAEIIADHFRIWPVDASKISVSGASSSHGDFPLSSVLNDADDEWWISGSGSMPGGIGNEYLEFSLGSRPCQVSVVAMKIPPWPHGPLSVRHFHLLALRSDKPRSHPDAWVVASPSPMETLDRADLQEFALVPPLETTAIRLVCTLNAEAATAATSPCTRRRPYAAADCVGLFQVRLA